MKGFLEQILQIALEGAYDEGSRFLKVKTFGVALRMLNGVRRLLILQYVLIVACFLCAMSTFAAAFLLFDQYQTMHTFALEPKLLFALAVMGVSSFVLWLTVRESAWIRMFNIEERVEAMAQESAFSQMVDVKAMAEMMEQIIEKKLEERFPPKKPPAKKAS